MKNIPCQKEAKRAGGEDQTSWSLYKILLIGLKFRLVETPV